MGDRVGSGAGGRALPDSDTHHNHDGVKDIPKIEEEADDEIGAHVPEQLLQCLVRSLVSRV